MNDFDIDKQFNNMQKAARAGMVVAAIVWLGSMVMGLALTGLAIWAVVHFILKLW